MVTRIENANVVLSFCSQYQCSVCSKKEYGTSFKKTIETSSLNNINDWLANIPSEPKNMPIGWASYLYGFKCPNCIAKESDPLPLPSKGINSRRNDRYKPKEMPITSNNWMSVLKVDKDDKD